MLLGWFQDDSYPNIYPNICLGICLGMSQVWPQSGAVMEKKLGPKSLRDLLSAEQAGGDLGLRRSKASSSHARVMPGVRAGMPAALAWVVACVSRGGCHAQLASPKAGGWHRMCDTAGCKVGQFVACEGQRNAPRMFFGKGITATAGAVALFRSMLQGVGGRKSICVYIGVVFAN
jgi:hypothetical protein